ncbi:MAG: FKBP-type peptidyl-prolyl cis-trans isomerase [Bacteroides sp.]|nr:FKBP-type peptidyl-prolyl cis-trans isomerase [Bacteroides sp.]MCM1413779.1 FKBP-type peptidyl-prolyl cis-trans isomerase [Bacteroides sp.]MCM1472202.1 FKBP-type peptidyl-prolyl cis-trans isomerase [Bacteroides sp.]
MKKLLLIGSVALLAIGFSACKGKGTGNGPKTYGDSLSYYMGQASGYGLLNNLNNMPEDMRDKVNKDDFLIGLKTVLDADTSRQDYLQGLAYGLQLCNQLLEMEKAGVNFDREVFFKEFKASFLADTVSTDQMMLLNEKLQPLMERAYNEMMKARVKEQEAYQKALQEKYDKNKAEGDKFVAEAMTKDKDLKKTESGLVYKVTKLGTGEVAKDTDRVNVVYKGTKINGEEFDSSNGQEVAFSPRGVVKGFGEALTTFPAGSQVTLYIPAELGYGKQAQGKIQPGETLVFDITIGDVVKPQAPAAPADTVKK